MLMKQTGNLVSTKKWTNKANAFTFVEKMLFISKTVGSNHYEPCLWLTI